MKLHYKLSIAIIASLAIVLPMSALAEDQTQDEKKQETKKAGGQRHGTEAAPQGTSQSALPASGRPRGENVHNEGRGKAVPQPNVAPVTSQSVQPNSRIERSQRNQTQPNVAPVTSQSVQPNSRLERSQRNQSKSNVAPVTSQSAQPSSRLERSQRNQPQSNVAPMTSQSVQPNSRLERAQRSQAKFHSNQQSYNKSNNYGGLWFAENTHSDWNRESHYYWNHHNYRWYEGGWLIIDGGYLPYGFNSGSAASNVQMSLANQGYYNGAIDGDIGPASRIAIADYQSDHDLRVTGRINDSLLHSLQID